MKATLSPKELGRAIGVSESTLKRWIDDGLLEVTRTPGGHRRIGVSEALRFIRRARVDVVRPEILGWPSVSSGGQMLRRVDLDQHLFEALREGDMDAARGAAMAAFLDGQPVAAIFDQVIRPALAKIGDLWTHDDAGVFIEHRATDLCIQSVVAIRLSLPEPPADAPVALGGAVTGDPFILASLMAATVAADAGFRDVNLGPDTPTEAFREAIRHHRPALVWISCSVDVEPPELRSLIRDVRRELDPLRAGLIVGGRGLCDADELRHEPGVHVASSMGEMAAFARGLLHAGPRGSTSHAESPSAAKPPAPEGD